MEPLVDTSRQLLLRVQHHYPICHCKVANDSPDLQSLAALLECLSIDTVPGGGRDFLASVRTAAAYELALELDKEFVKC